MEIQYYNKIRWGLAPLAPNDAPPLVVSIKHWPRSTPPESVFVLLVLIYNSMEWANIVKIG
jgi:hypothetical protein